MPLNESDQPTQKPCRVCGEDIKLAARKCIHCGSWQGRILSKLGLSTESLALVVALTSVLTVGLPPLLRTFVKRDANIRAYFQSDSAQYLSFLVNNSGDKPGTFSSAFLVIAPDIPISPKNLHELGSSQTIQLYVDAPEEPAILVAPGSTRLLALQSYGRISEGWLTKSNIGGHCEIDFYFRDSHGNPIDQAMREPCKYFEFFIEAHLKSISDTP